MTGPSLYLRGLVLAEVTSADPAQTVTDLASAGVRFWEPELKGPLTMRIFLYKKDLTVLEACCRRRGDSVKVLGKKSLAWDLLSFLHRPVLVFGLALLLVMSAVLPKRLWFLRFEGNEQTTLRELTAAAEASGLRFFAYVPDLKSEEIKNRMVNLVPELSWVGVRFEGGIATISVREQEVRPQIRDRDIPANVVAARSGIITSMNVLGGQARCQVGQAVLEGEMLVAGYVDCQTHTQVTQADAEIYAITQHEVRAVFPGQWLKKGETEDSKTQISLILGRRRINLFGNSSILPATYDKITSCYPLTLPGGYVLPLTLEIQRSDRRSLTESSCGPGDELSSFCGSYTESQMLAGRILSADTELSRIGTDYILTGTYTCEEMIARQRAAELFEGDTKDVGTNS